MQWLSEKCANKSACVAASAVAAAVALDFTHARCGSGVLFPTQPIRLLQLYIRLAVFQSFSFRIGLLGSKTASQNKGIHQHHSVLLACL